MNNLFNIRGLIRIRNILSKAYKPLPVGNVSSGSYRFKSTSKPDSVYLIDEDNSQTTARKDANQFTTRTHTCGELNIENVRETVILSGWLEYQRLGKFVVLRDSYGETQLLIDEKDKTTQKTIEDLPYESILQVKGTVLSRPEKMRNPKQSTGEIEVRIEQLSVLNKAQTNLPFNIREFQKAKEALRLKYRYLDLRFSEMQQNLRVRSQFLMKMREFLINTCGFVDVETPTLFKATPGGAQEFIVPTRFPGEFYSLVQSPQQFKQMLMAGAIDRYFQIARCYRDESARSDRQPEFTQLDIEMSFTTLDGIMGLIEAMLGYSWPDFYPPLPPKFPRITFEEAMENYGTDQPDTRFDFKLQNCTSLMKHLQNTDDYGSYYLVFPGTLTKSFKTQTKEVSKQYSAKLITTKVTNRDEFITKMSPVLGEDAIQNLQVRDDSNIFISYGSKDQARKLLGKIRVNYAEYLENNGEKIRTESMNLLWIVDFPLFEPGDQAGSLNSAHHPFTAPNPDDFHLLSSDPLKVRGLSYDLVLNGNEIGGGSIRIHDPEVQKTVLQMLNIKISDMQHIIDMLASGCPPHGGIALGIDRLMSKILKTTSIRDVIAFPKSFEGRDPLSGAPSPISDKEEKLYHIKSVV